MLFAVARRRLSCEARLLLLQASDGLGVTDYGAAVLPPHTTMYARSRRPASLT